MRHLSVPSAQTQLWLDICRTHNWSSNEAGVTRLEDGRNALPLNDSAPLESDQVWKSNPHLEIEIQPKGPTHWLDHIDEELADAHREDWPRSYEIQGDILIVKIEEVVWDYGELIADAMLTQLPNIRLVCADMGVKGEFRVRELHPLASRDGTVETRTRIRENGYLLWVDSSKVYFSARLSNERIETSRFSQTITSENLVAHWSYATPMQGLGQAWERCSTNLGSCEDTWSATSTPTLPSYSRSISTLWLRVAKTNRETP